MSSEEELVQSETNDEYFGTIYEFKKSKSSFKIEDVKGIIYGGVSFRFWMFRKYLN